MKRSKNFFKLEEKHNGGGFRNDVFIQSLGEKELVSKNKNLIQHRIFKHNF